MLWFSEEYPQTDAPYAIVWLHQVSCGSSLFSSQEKFSFICSCQWAQMHTDTAKSKKGKCLFSKTKDNSDSLDSKIQVLESRRHHHSKTSVPRSLVPLSWFWWWIRSTLQLHTQLGGLIYAGWQVVMLWLFFFLAPALLFFFTALSKVWILTMTHLCQWP